MDLDTYIKNDFELPLQILIFVERKIDEDSLMRWNSKWESPITEQKLLVGMPV